MNKEVEELLQYLRVNISDEDEFIQISNLVNTIKQAFTDMEEENALLKRDVANNEFNTIITPSQYIISFNFGDIAENTIDDDIFIILEVTA